MDRLDPTPATRAAITGWGYYVPEPRLTNHDLEQLVDTNDQWIVERTGIRERRIAPPGEGTASMAAEAAARAIKDAGLTPSDLDLMIVATCTGEQPIPHTGAFVADILGLHCGSFDVNAACTGFVVGLVNAAGLMAIGGLRHVLVIGAETISRFTDPTDRGTCVLFADGAAAVVLSPAPADGPGLLAFDLGCDGAAARFLEVPAGGARLPASVETLERREHYLKMAGQEVFKRAVRAIEHSARVTLERAGLTADDIDWFVPHQANVRIIETAANRLGLPMERTLLNIERYGNTSGASIPLVLAEFADAGTFKDGDLVLMSGFGAGMTWGSAILRWGQP